MCLRGLEVPWRRRLRGALEVTWRCLSGALEVPEGLVKTARLGHFNRQRVWLKRPGLAFFTARGFS